MLKRLLIISCILLTVVLPISYFYFLLSVNSDVFSVSLDNQPDIDTFIYKDDLSFSDFFEPHENRINPVDQVSVFPNLIVVFVHGFLGQWNTTDRSVIALGIGMINTLVLIILLFATGILSVQKWISCIVAVAFVTPFLLLRQHEQWLWGGHKELHLDTFGVLITSLMLSIANKTTHFRICLIIASLAAAVASLSYGLSLLIWPVFAGFFLLQKNLRIYVIPWALVGGMVFSLYFWNHTPSIPILDISQMLPYAILDYIFMYISGGLVANFYLGLTLLSSFTFMILFVINRRKLTQSKILIWVILGVYSFVLAIVQAYINVDFSELQATSSAAYRVSILFLTAWLALLLIIAKSSHKFFSNIMPIVIGAIIIVSIAHTDSAFQHGKTLNITRAISDSQVIDTFDWKILPNRFEIGHVDSMIKQDTGHIQIVGWAQHPFVRDIVETIYVVADGKNLPTVRSQFLRKDVATFWGKHEYSNSGWGLVTEDAFTGELSEVTVYLKINETTLLKLN